MILLSFNRLEKIDNELLLLFCENEPLAVHLPEPLLGRVALLPSDGAPVATHLRKILHRHVLCAIRWLEFLVVVVLLISALDVMPIVLAVLDAVLLVPHLLISVVQLEPVLQPVVAVSLDDIGGRSGR